jgi:hypothetical protein
VEIAGGKTERVVTVGPFPKPPEETDFGSPDFYAAIAPASSARWR